MIRYSVRQLVAVVVLIVAAAIMAFFGGWQIFRTFTSYHDASDVVFFALGAFALAVSALFAWATLIVLAPSPRRGTVRLFVLLTLCASAPPYGALLGWSGGYLLNAALLVVAVGVVVAYGL